MGILLGISYCIFKAGKIISYAGRQQHFSCQYIYIPSSLLGLDGLLLS